MMSTPILTVPVSLPHGGMKAEMLVGIAQFERDLPSERAKSGQRPKSDRLAAKVLHSVDGGRSYRWSSRDLGIQQELHRRYRQTTSGKPVA